MPRRGNRCTAWLSRATLALMGWRVAGALPDRPRLVLVGAPHTSNWDFVVALAAAFALGIELHWLGKHTLFIPPLGWLMRRLGGVPVDRRVQRGVVAQCAAALRSRERMLLAIAPEGTRRRVHHWKSGFYHIVREAGVPLCLCTLHSPRRLLTLGPLFTPGPDPDADLAAIRAHFRPFRGRHTGP